MGNKSKREDANKYIDEIIAFFLSKMFNLVIKYNEKIYKNLSKRNNNNQVSGNIKYAEIKRIIEKYKKKYSSKFDVKLKILKRQTDPLLQNVRDTKPHLLNKIQNSLKKTSLIKRIKSQLRTNELYDYYNLLKET